MELDELELVEPLLSLVLPVELVSVPVEPDVLVEPVLVDPVEVEFVDVEPVLVESVEVGSLVAAAVGVAVAVGAVDVSVVGDDVVTVLCGTSVAAIGSTAVVVDVVAAVSVVAASVTELGGDCGCVAVHCWITFAAGLRVQSVRSTPNVS